MKWQEATGCKVKNSLPSPCPLFPREPNVIWPPNPHPSSPLNKVSGTFTGLLTFTSKGHVSGIMLILKYLTHWPLFPIPNIPSLDPRTKTNPILSPLPESSLYLVGSSLYTCPFHIVHLQGHNGGPLYFIPGAQGHSTYTSVTVFLAYLRVPQCIRSFFTPFFLRFQHSLLFQLSFIAPYVGAFLSSVPTATPLSSALSSLPYK